MPAAFKSCQHVLFRDVFDAHLMIVLGIISIHYAIDFVLCLTQPILLEVVKDDFDFGFAARQEAAVRDCNGQGASKHTAKMCDWMCQLILLIVSIFQVDKYAQVMCSGCDSDTSTCEFGAYLVETACADTFHGAIDKEGGDRGVMRSLLGDV